MLVLEQISSFMIKSLHLNKLCIEFHVFCLLQYHSPFLIRPSLLQWNGLIRGVVFLDIQMQHELSY